MTTNDNHGLVITKRDGLYRIIDSKMQGEYVLRSLATRSEAELWVRAATR